MRNRWIPIVAVLVIATASSMALAEPVQNANQGMVKEQQQNMFQNRLGEFMDWFAQWAYGFGPGTGTCEQNCQGTGDCDCDGIGDQDRRRQRDRIHTPETSPDPDRDMNRLRDGSGTGTCLNLG